MRWLLAATMLVSCVDRDDVVSPADAGALPCIEAPTLQPLLVPTELSDKTITVTAFSFFAVQGWGTEAASYIRRIHNGEAVDCGITNRQ